MKIARTRSQLEKYLWPVDRHGTGFVPTMGALHAGHISLVRRAREENGTVVVSIFVNPTQFNDPADLANYPRTEQEDLRLLEDAGADIVFIPSVEEMYPEPDGRVFDFGGLDSEMEGATRPGHFNGVAQIVSKLFEAVNPARAYFGEKDFQQVAIVKKMTGDLGLDIEIVTCPTVREKDGLAMSSRNTLLLPEYRAAAPKIYRALAAGVKKTGEMSPAEVERFVTDEINSDPLLEVIYFKIVDALTLRQVESWEEEGAKQGCVAVRAGDVRLIDNIRFV
jgi:pantoate--beta-alanine ligase